MIKELEALNELFDLVTCQDCFEKGQKCYNIIEEALQRLEAIDSANSSEAMKCLNFLKNESIDDIACFKNSVTTKTLYQLYFGNFDVIEQALVRAQELEKENTEYRDFKTDVVKKALKGGIYAKDSLDENKLNYIPSVALSNVEDEWYLSNHCDFCVNVKDYKTLFWLNKDKSE